MGAADIFQNGETATLTAKITDPQSGDRVAPDTITITIYDPADQTAVDAETMSPETGSTGEYYYHFDTAGQTNGVFKFLVKATRSTRITIDKNENNCFTVE